MKRTITLALAAILFASCATRISVLTTKPAEANLAGARKIAILDFDYPRYSKTGDPLELLRLSLSGRLTGGRADLEYELALYATRELVGAVSAGDYFAIVDDDTVVERMTGYYGLGEPSAVEIGTRVGVDAFIAGEIVECKRDTNTDYVKHTLKNPDTGLAQEYRVEYTTAVDKVTLSYKVISAVTGEVLATKTLSGTEEQKVKGGSSHLLDQGDQCKKAIAKMMPAVVKQLAPYQVRERRALASDKAGDPLMKRAEALAKGKSYQEALSIYLELWKGTANGAAGIDGAIMYELLGRVDEALSLIDEVVGSGGDKAAIKERARLRQVQADQKKLADQLGPQP